jgi:hypothetical protein
VIVDAQGDPRISPDGDHAGGHLPSAQAAGVIQVTSGLTRRAG